MNALRGLLFSAFLLLVNSGWGCATIVSSGPDTVKFTSEPSGATVAVDGAKVGQTPVDAKVARKAKLVTYSLAGHEETVLPVSRHFNGWVIGNILFGGLIGIIIDISTGNDSIADEKMHAVLHRASAATIGDARRAVSAGAEWLKALVLEVPHAPR